MAEMNAINAALAVLRWKQFMGFYLDQEHAHNLNYTLSFQSVARSEHLEPEAAELKNQLITPVFVEFIPDQIEPGKLYISEKYETAIHKCCFGCGEEVSM